MKYKILVGLLVCTAAVLALTVLLLYAPWAKNQSFNSQAVKAEGHHNAYFMQADFYTPLHDLGQVQIVNQPVFGAIVSHHFFTEKEIAKLYAELDGQDYDTIVVIGPNHFNAGSGEVLASAWPYQTPWGELEPNTDVINFLSSHGLVKIEEQPFVREHSISVEVGFIKRQFPKARIVPIILKRNTPEDTAEKLAAALNKILPPKSLVLASVDFSHHVTNQVAQQQDKTSVALIQNLDLAGLNKLSPTAMDSPISIMTLLDYLKFKQATSMQFYNTNQALLSGNLNNTDVTSYLFAAFTK